MVGNELWCSGDWVLENESGQMYLRGCEDKPWCDDGSISTADLRAPKDW
jgi:hypothetical protein